MSNQSKNLTGLAIVMGMGLGWLDLAQIETQMTVVGIAAAAFLLGFAHPHRAWVWAIFIGSTIFTTHWLAGWAGIAPPYLLVPNLMPTLNTFIPAFLGAYLGVMVQMSLQEVKIKGVMETRGQP